MAKVYTKGSTVVDEVLSGAERYDIKDNGGTPIESNVQINLATSVSVAGTAINAARLNNIETGIDTLDTKVADANDLLTTGGTTTAYTLTTTGAAALATGERFRVKFNATAGATPTLNRDSKGAKSLKYYDSTGAKTACTASNIVANLITDVVYDGTDYVVLDPAGVSGAGGGDKYAMEARLTLETGVPLSITNQLAKTTLYLTKYNGDQIAVYNGTSWSNLTLGSDISISLSGLGRSQAYTNDPASGSNIVLNMTNTAGFIVGDIVKVSSSAGSEEATITVVTANTSITVDALALNHTTSSPLVTGKLPYDVYVYSNAGSPALELVAWTNRTTRATVLTTQNGVKVKTGDTSRRYIGVISTTLTLGQCEFMVSGGTTVTQKILVQNYYNKLPAPVFIAETTDTWNWTTVAWRQLNGSKYNQFDFIDGDGEMLLNAMLTYESYTTSGALDAYGAFGLDQAATVNSATVGHVSAAVNTNSIGYAVYNSPVAVGGHYLTLMEYGRAAMVVIGDSGLKRTGATGIFWC